MVDMVRTLSALQTLLADNTDGEISAQDIRDLLVSVYPVIVGCETTKTSQTIANDTATFISWGTEVRDDGGCFDAGAPTRWTAPVTGYYIATFFVDWTNGHLTNDLTITGFYRTGSQVTFPSELKATTSADRRTMTTQVIYLGAGDYLECRVQQSSGGNADIASAWGSFALINGAVGVL